MPRRALFDTSAVIGLTERRSPALVAVVKEHGGPIVRSVTVVGELNHGAELRGRPGQDERRLTSDRYGRLSQWSDHEVDLDEVGRVYGQVAAIAGQDQLKLATNDMWIIAECITQGTSLVTSDRRQAEVAELAASRLSVPFDVVLAD